MLNPKYEEGQSIEFLAQAVYYRSLFSDSTKQSKSYAHPDDYPTLEQGQEYISLNWQDCVVIHQVGIKGDPTLCLVTWFWFCRHGKFPGVHQAKDLEKLKYSSLQGTIIKYDFRLMSNSHFPRKEFIC